MDIVGIGSNHRDLEPLAVQHGLPFHHLPVTADTKPQQEARLLDLFDTSGAELMILARYMQILSGETSRKLAHARSTSIIHSARIQGAKPYHQAHTRGVKLIGATAHFVTDDLDEGPIIEQVVERVDHSYKPERLLATGRDVECITLARAVRRLSSGGCLSTATGRSCCSRLDLPIKTPLESKRRFSLKR